MILHDTRGLKESTRDGTGCVKKCEKIAVRSMRCGWSRRDTAAVHYGEKALINSIAVGPAPGMESRLQPVKALTIPQRARIRSCLKVGERSRLKPGLHTRIASISIIINSSL